MKQQLSRDQVLAQFNKILAQARSAQLEKWTRKTLSRALVWSSLAQRAKQTATDQRTLLLEQVLSNPYCSSDLRKLCLQKLSSQACAGQMQHSINTQMETLQAVDDGAIKLVIAERILEKLKTSERARARVEQRCMQGDAWMLDCLQRMCAIERANPHSFVHSITMRITQQK